MIILFFAAAFCMYWTCTTILPAVPQSSSANSTYSMKSRQRLEIVDYNSDQSGTWPNVVALFPTNLSSILDVFFLNDKFMFSHFRWWLWCNKMISYMVDTVIIFFFNYQNCSNCSSISLPRTWTLSFKNTFFNITQGQNRTRFVLCLQNYFNALFYTNNLIGRSYHQSDGK